MATIETMEGAQLVVDLIDQLHRAASEAAALGFPRMARHLDECGFELATELRTIREAPARSSSARESAWTSGRPCATGDSAQRS